MSFGVPARSSSSRPSQRLAAWPLVAAAALAAGCGPAPASTAPASGTTAAPVASAAPVKPAFETLWQHRSSTGIPPEISYLAANSKREVFFSSQPTEGARFIRLDASGQLAWEMKLTGDETFADGVALDEQGNAYVAARVGPRVALDGKSLDGPGYASALLLKVAPDGKKLWHTIFKGSEVTAPSVAVSTGGAVLFAGGFAEDVVLGPDLLRGGVEGAGYSMTERNLFLAGVEPGGRVLWGKEFLVTGLIAGMAADAKGQVVLWGDGWSPGAFNAAAPARSQGRSDRRAFFVAKLDASGKYRWHRQINAPNVAPSGDGSGDVYLCDSDSKNSDVVKVADSGQVTDRWPLSEPKDPLGCGNVASDDKGNVYVLAIDQIDPGDADRPVFGEPLRIVKLDRTGKILATLDLPHSIVVFMHPSRIVWAGGHLYVSAVKVANQTISSVLLDVTM